MGATVALYQDTGATGSTNTNVDSSGGTAPKFGTDDAVVSTTFPQIPTSTGTNFSAHKNIYLRVTTAAATTISNRRIKARNRTWAATTAYAVGDLIDGGNSHVYVCTTAGTSGGSAPTFPTTSGATVTDGSVVWTEAGAGPMPKGTTLGWKANTGAYAQGTVPTASGSNGAVPTGYTAITTSNAVYDNSSVSAGSTGKNGAYTQLAFGVDATYPFGAGPIGNPILDYTYDEA